MVLSEYFNKQKSDGNSIVSVIIVKKITFMVCWKICLVHVVLYIDTLYISTKKSYR